jgi:hypothetical protein
MSTFIREDVISLMVVSMLSLRTNSLSGRRGSAESRTILASSSLFISSVSRSESIWASIRRILLKQNLSRGSLRSVIGETAFSLHSGTIRQLLDLAMFKIRQRRSFELIGARPQGRSAGEGRALNGQSSYLRSNRDRNRRSDVEGGKNRKGLTCYQPCYQAGPPTVLLCLFADWPDNRLRSMSIAFRSRLPELIEFADCQTILYRRGRVVRMTTPRQCQHYFSTMSFFRVESAVNNSSFSRFPTLNLSNDSTRCLTEMSQSSWVMPSPLCAVFTSWPR